MKYTVTIFPANSVEQLQVTQEVVLWEIYKLNDLLGN